MYCFETAEGAQFKFPVSLTRGGKEDKHMLFLSHAFMVQQFSLFSPQRNVWVGLVRTTGFLGIDVKAKAGETNEKKHQVSVLQWN